LLSPLSKGRILSPEVKESERGADHSPQSSPDMNTWSYYLASPIALVAWCLIETEQRFNFMSSVVPAAVSIKHTWCLLCYSLSLKLEAVSYPNRRYISVRLHLVISQGRVSSLLHHPPFPSLHGTATAYCLVCLQFRRPSLVAASRLRQNCPFDWALPDCERNNQKGISRGMPLMCWAVTLTGSSRRTGFLACIFLSGRYDPPYFISTLFFAFFIRCFTYFGGQPNFISSR
jgi:hypothetical protein